MKTVINIKTDRLLKTKAVKTARAMGLPLSIVVNAFLKKFVEEQRVSFSTPLKLSKKLIGILREVDEDIQTGGNLSPVFTDMRKMDHYLDNL